MFTKYLNQFGKAEAEWVLEILDLYDGDEPKAREAVLESVQRIIEARKAGHPPVDPFDKAIDAACFANRVWWPVGLARLHKLGKISAPA